MAEPATSKIGHESSLAVLEAKKPPASWATINPGTPFHWIPANVSVMALAIVTAGFANDVDEVNQ